MLEISIRGELTQTEKVEQERLNKIMKASHSYSDKEREKYLLIIQNTITLLIRPKKRL